MSRDITSEHEQEERDLRAKLETHRLKATELLIRSLRHDMLATLLNVVYKELSDYSRQMNFDLSDCLDKLAFSRSYISQLEWWLPDRTAVNIATDLQEVQLSGIVDRVTSWCHHILKTPVVVNRIPKELYMRADRTLMHILFLNVVHNSKKMTSDRRASEPILVDASLCVREDMSRVLLVSIDDGGCHIPDTINRSLLGNQLGVSASPAERTTHGSGFGLFLCARIAEAHGGCMRIPSNSSRGGTVVEFEFPV